ncbi:LPD28 domain-containing protein, partial [Hungatella effluvii]
TLVAGFNKWKNQFERHVKKGEHGITIIAPTPYKKKIEEMKRDPDTHAPILDADGKAVMEKKEIEIPMFRPVKVFDVSQTDGKPLPELASSLSGTVPHYEAFLEAVRRSAPVPIEFEPMADNMDGYFSPERQRIAIREGMSEVQTVSAAVHEIAHSKLHNQKKIQIDNDQQYQEVELFEKPALFSNGRISHDDLPEGVYCYDLRGSDDDPGFPICVEERVVVNHAGSVILTAPLEFSEEGRLYFTDENGLNFNGGMLTLSQFLQEQKKDRRTEEVEAESISYAVCQYFGIQTGENSFGYIASWSKGKELKELRASLETINKTSCELINDIERHYKEICKERGIDLTAKQEPEQADIPQKALFLLNDATYLHIQPCDTGWDYTLYDKETMKELDGGQLDEPELSRSAAVRQICEGLELENPSIQDAPLSMIETLQDAACQQMQEQVSQQTAETAATQLPDAQEQSLDEYPMPDSEVSVSDMQEYGYLYDGMLPVTRERALELDAAGLTVYLLHEDNTESMVFDTEEIMEHGGLFGVEHEEWEQSPAFHEKVLERQERQMEREQAFLAHEGSCFAIYQVSRDDPQNVRFMNLDWLQSHNLAVDRNNYDMIYTAPLNGSGSAMEQLETLYEQFNLQKPVDFHSPSMSVSDIVAIKQDGKVSCHYCDSVGFTEIPGFLPDNPLKNAEMMLEDDYGMIDGIINNGPKERTVAQLEQQARSGQPISLMDLAAAAHREERDKKKSVMEQLKSQPRTERKKAAPKKSAEREI